MTFEETIERIYQLVESLANEAIDSSQTYKQAIDKLKAHRYYAHDDVSLATVNMAIRTVNSRALLSLVDKNDD